jgi:signal transduction histidine kinase
VFSVSHDGLGQELVAGKMLLDSIAKQHPGTRKDQLATDAEGIPDRAIQQLRSISHLLHPPLLVEVDLLSALRWYLDGLTNRGSIETSLQDQPVDFPRLAPELETTIFRIVQEALTNVFRHSGAQRSWVTLFQGDSRLEITVRDDG